MIESGYAGFTMVTWNGLAAPAGTPPEVVEKLATAVRQTLQIPKNREMFSGLVVTPVGNTPAEFAAEIKSDIKFWGDAVRAVVSEKTN